MLRGTVSLLGPSLSVHGSLQAGRRVPKRTPRSLPLPAIPVWREVRRTRPMTTGPPCESDGLRKQRPMNE